ncbi:putative zinc finger protein 730 [Oppia nitens]|uniref:putative zinc finger protein 730 n=1 Tax=Oppia nitens TaxID=1686743 RepID=UPI0023DB4B04|nr:putative zinc finger protein 730 [Oppia nitens]
MSSMVVTVDDIVDQLWSENKRLLKELLFANKCLNILDELKSELNLIYKKFETQLNTEDKFNQLRHQLNNICDQRRDKGLHLNDVNLDEIQDKTNTYINIENNQLMDNGIQLIDNIKLEENENVIQINQLNNTEVIANETKDDHILGEQLNEREDILRLQSNNKTNSILLIYNKKDNTIEYKCLDCDNKFLTRNSLKDHMLNSHKKRLIFRENCINQQKADLQTKNNTNNDLMAKKCKNKKLIKIEDKIIINNNNNQKVKEIQPINRVCKKIVSKHTDNLIRKDRNDEEVRNEDNLNNHKTNDDNLLLLPIISNTKDPIVVYKCSNCSMVFKGPKLYQKVLLLQHINHKKICKQRVIRSKPGGYKCLNSDCQQTLRTLRQYRKHQSTCLINCSQCAKKYRCQRSYVNHQMKDHGLGGELPYKCDYIGCNYQTASLGLIRNHESITHSTDRPFVCNIDGCLKSFKTTSNLQSHQAIHSEKKYVCNVDGCHKRFTRKKEYGRHLAEHMSEPTLKCPDNNCRQLFYTDREIYIHRRDYHKRKVKSNNRKIYKQCDWPDCDYYGLSLKRHQIIHTGEKNYRCDWPECGKRFACKQKLIEHMNIHNNVKPFACRWPGCEYRCAHHSNINKHMKQVHQKQ